MAALTLISLAGAVALGAFISLDRPSGGNQRDGALLHGGLAAMAFLVASMVRPDMAYVEDFVGCAIVASIVIGRFVLAHLRRVALAAGYDGSLQADMVTLTSAICVGATLSTGSAKSVVFVLLAASLAAALKARRGGIEVVAAKVRHVAIYPSVEHLVEKLNAAQVALREEAAMPVAGLRLISARLREVERWETETMQPRRSLSRDHRLAVRRLATSRLTPVHVSLASA